MAKYGEHPMHLQGVTLSAQNTEYTPKDHRFCYGKAGEQMDYLIMILLYNISKQSLQSEQYKP
jgi:hypothetical protein